MAYIISDADARGLDALRESLAEVKTRTDRSCLDGDECAKLSDLLFAVLSRVGSSPIEGEPEDDADELIVERTPAQAFEHYLNEAHRILGDSAKHVAVAAAVGMMQYEAANHLAVTLEQDAFGIASPEVSIDPEFARALMEQAADNDDAADEAAEASKH